MSNQKFKANQIFTGTNMLPEQFVLITNEDGTIEAIVDEADAGDEVQNFTGILCPGFINAHCHVELSHMKGIIPKHIGLINFIVNVVNQRNNTEPIIYEAIKNAEEEMLKNGIVAVGDICNTNNSFNYKLKSALTWYNFIEVSGWLPEVAEKRFAQVKEIELQFKAVKNNQQTSIVPHAPYSVSKELWQKIEGDFEGKTITIHNQESKAENDLFINGTGDFIAMYQLMNIENVDYKPSKKTSVQTYYSSLHKAKNRILVHNTFTSEEDVRYIQNIQLAPNNSTFFCLCANANLYIENKLPDIEMLRKNNCTIVLGTDSLASNNSLSIVDEIQTIRKNFPTISLVEILQWATLNGAKALQLDDSLGSFEKEKKPGVVLWNNDLVKRLI